jgi:Bacterial SH3 domain
VLAEQLLRINIEENIENILNEIQNIKDSNDQKLFYLVLVPFIIALMFSIINPITQYYVNDYFAKDKRVVKKEINQKIIKSVINIDDIKFFRYINCKVLLIRDKPNSKSPNIGRLYFGQAVHLIEKNKDWSLVSWSDGDNSVMLKGWVFTRYLSKFN